MNILILSDSLTLPRNNGDDQTLDYFDTWPTLLAMEFPKAVMARVGIGSATTTEILYQTQYWTGFPADFTFVQAGLCDCRPRAFNRLELEIIKRLPGKPEFWKRQVDKRTTQLRKCRNICYTPPGDFADNLFRIKQTLPNVHWINIAQRKGDPSHLHGTTQQIQTYNEIIHEQYGDRLIDVSILPDSLIMNDHFHMNAEGHRWLFEQVKSIITMAAADASPTS